MAKGPKWERDLCNELSQWWSRKGDDDLFWRTHGSGARATVRSKKNKKTRGQYGDMAANDSRGATLIKAFTWSFKRGYSKKTMQDLIDALENPNRDGSIPEQEYAGWIREAICADRHSGSLCWIIIVRRDKRKSVVLVPNRLLLMLKKGTKKKLNKIAPQFSMITWVKRLPNLTQKDKNRLKKVGWKKKQIKKEIKKRNKRNLISILGYPMHEFLDVVDRSVICQMVKENR
jgi:hypothetical protein